MRFLSKLRRAFADPNIRTVGALRDEFQQWQQNGGIELETFLGWQEREGFRLVDVAVPEGGGLEDPEAPVSYRLDGAREFIDAMEDLEAGCSKEELLGVAQRISARRGRFEVPPGFVRYEPAR